MRVDGPGITEVIIIPDVIQDLLAGQRDALVLDEVEQKFILLEAELDLLSIDLH